MVEPERVGLFGKLLERQVGHVADLVGLIDDPSDRPHDHAGHQDQQSEHDQAGAESGLDLVTFEASDHRLEDHREHGGEGQRQDDLTDC